MSNQERLKTSLKERLKEQEEERVNNEVYLGFINNDSELFIKRLARKFNNRSSIVHVINRLNKSNRELSNDIIEWFKFPNHINTVCNIYLIIDKYYTVDSEHLIGLLSWLFEKYEHKAWELWYDKYKENGYIDKYTDKQVKSILRKHGFLPMEKVKFDKHSNWLYNTKFKLIYPKPFDAHINSLDTKNPGIYLAGKLYGLAGHTAAYIGPQDGLWITESSKSTYRFIESNTIQ